MFLLIHIYYMYVLENIDTAPICDMVQLCLTAQVLLVLTPRPTQYVFTYTFHPHQNLICQIMHNAVLYLNNPATVPEGFCIDSRSINDNGPLGNTTCQQFW